MRHLGCVDIITRTEIEDRDVRLTEVTCVHGFRWYEGPDVEARGWHPRSRDEARKCACGCGRALPSLASNNRKYVTDECRVKHRRALAMAS